MRILRKCFKIFICIVLLLNIFPIQDVKAISLTGSTNAEKVFNYFYSHGYSKYAAAGIVGNILWESGSGGNLNFPLHITEGGSGEGIGMCQWSFDRKTAFKDYCKSQGVDWTQSTLEHQVGYLELELNNGSYWYFPSDVYSSSLNKYNTSLTNFKRLADIDLATGTFCFSFERPSEQHAGMSTRVKYAKKVLELYGGNPTTSYDIEVIFDTQGASTPIASKIYKFSDEIILPTKDQLMKDGYEFKGFYLKRNYDNTYYVSKEGWKSLDYMNSNKLVPTLYHSGTSLTIDENWTNDPKKNNSFTVIVVWDHKISFELNDGKIKEPLYSFDIDGINRTRDAGQLVVYNKDGQIVNTNKWGCELAIDKTGKVIDKRESGSSQKLTVPASGAVISVHGNGQPSYSLTNNLKIGDYVYIDYKDNKVHGFKSYYSFLYYLKVVENKGQYGVLPIPQKDGYYFKGWYKEPTYKNEVTYFNDYTSNNLYAKWDKTLTSTKLTDYDGHTYMLFDYSMSYDDAKMICESLGGYLVTITSKDENNVITSLIHEGNRCYYRLGCTSKDKLGNWKWETGETFSYQNWDTSDLEGSSDKYAYITSIDHLSHQTNGEWIDETDIHEGEGYFSYCNIGFVCEFDRVIRPITSVELNKTNLTLMTGQSESLTATINPSDTTDDTSLTWHSSDESIATVKNGKITALKEGTTTISVTTSNGKQSSCHVIVREMVFDDVKKSKWYYSVVKEAFIAGLMTGTSETTFSPDDNMTRGMIVSVLHRIAGKPASTYSGRFLDVSSKSYCASAVEWAAKNKVVSGYANGKFGPNDNITRQDVAVMLYNYAKNKKIDVSNNTNLTKFKDCKSVSPYAKEAMQWAVSVGILSGSTKDGKTYLNPKDNATRAECAKMLLVASKIYK